MAKRGGTGYTKTTSGYILVYKPSHPNSMPNGYVKEHRLIMEFHIGRYLCEDEIIHHINEIKDDNSIDNLQITNRAEHRAIHNKDKKDILKFNEEEVRKLYLEGNSTREVAKILGMGKSTVSEYIKRMGISRPKMSKRDNCGKFRKVV